MIIITLANQKGGVGKSTIALNLAYALNQSLKVGIYDVDLQGSISNEEVNEELTLVPPVQDINILKTLTLDVLIIDTPPYLTSRLKEVLSITDLVIVPMKSSAFDTLAFISTLKLIEEVQRSNRGLKSFIVYSMVIHNSSVSKQMSEIIESFGMPVFKTRIIQRVVYIRSQLEKGVINSNNEKAKAEILSLVEEITEIL